MEVESDFLVEGNVKNIPDKLLGDLKTCLPEGYRTLVTSFNELPSSIFEFVLRLNIRSKEAALKWFDCYKKKSLTSWTVSKCYPAACKYIIFKRGFRCFHNTKPAKGTTPSKKHTGCPVRMKITIKRVYEKSKSKDVHLKERTCEILLGVSHNHSLNSAFALKFRKPSQEVEAIFKHLLLCKGHSPASAWKSYKFDLQHKYGDKYTEVAADGSICPNKYWVYHLNNKLNKNGLQPSISKNDTVTEENVDFMDAEDFCDDDVLLPPISKNDTVAQGNVDFLDAEDFCDDDVLLPSISKNDTVAEENVDFLDAEDFCNEDGLHPSIGKNDTVAEENVDLLEAEDFCDQTLKEICCFLKPYIKHNPLAFKAAFVNAKKYLQECKLESEILSLFHNCGKTSIVQPINKEHTSDIPCIKNVKKLQCGVVTVQQTAVDRSKCLTGTHTMIEHNYAASNGRKINASTSEEQGSTFERKPCKVLFVSSEN